MGLPWGMTSEAQSAGDLSPLERFLSLFAKMEPGEGAAVVLNFCNIFLILASYYILKVVRNGLIVSETYFGIPGDEILAYAPVVMAVLLAGVIPLYGYAASKVSRIKLINSCYFIVVGCLGLFFLLGSAGVPKLGLYFFIWLGVVNVFLISQFWQFANDIYSKPQGERLFAVIAIGGAAGAALGPFIAKLHDDVFVLMVVAGGVLLACLFLFNTVNKLEVARAHARKGLEDRKSSVKQQLKNTMTGSAEDIKAEIARQKKAQEEGVDAKPAKDDGDGDDAEKPLGKAGGFQLVFKQKYLLLIGLMVLTANLINTTGEFILANAAKTYAAQESSIPADIKTKLDALPQDPPEAEKQAVEEERTALRKTARSAAGKNFYADFFFWVNVVVLIIQMFFVSRIFKYIGVRAALFVLPVIALGGYLAIGLIGGLMVLRISKTAENATDYSLQNTIKQALFLPTSRDAKYKAKAAIDTFFVRFGDLLAAALVWVGLHQLSFTATSFALTNVALALVWLGLNVGIAKGHKELSGEDEEPAKA
jgi:AAA family ATP:ADP antiporter